MICHSANPASKPWQKRLNVLNTLFVDRANCIVFCAAGLVGPAVACLCLSANVRASFRLSVLLKPPAKQTYFFTFSQCVIIIKRKSTEHYFCFTLKHINNKGSPEFWCLVRATLEPVYTKCQRQRCDYACDSVLIENSRVAWKWVANPFWSNSIVFNENRIASIITVLTLGINGP